MKRNAHHICFGTSRLLRLHFNYALIRHALKIHYANDALRFSPPFFTTCSDVQIQPYYIIDLKYNYQTKYSIENDALSLVIITHDCLNNVHASSIHSLNRLMKKMCETETEICKQLVNERMVVQLLGSSQYFVVGTRAQDCCGRGGRLEMRIVFIGWWRGVAAL